MYLVVMRFFVLIQFPFGGFLNHGGTPKSSIFMGLSILNHPKRMGYHHGYGNPYSIDLFDDPWIIHFLNHLSLPFLTGKGRIYRKTPWLQWENPWFIELDDGKILTGLSPFYLMGIKPMGFRLRFSLKPIQWMVSQGQIPHFSARGW